MKETTPWAEDPIDKELRRLQEELEQIKRCGAHSCTGRLLSVAGPASPFPPGASPSRGGRSLLNGG